MVNKQMKNAMRSVNFEFTINNNEENLMDGHTNAGVSLECGDKDCVIFKVDCGSALCNQENIIEIDIKKYRDDDNIVKIFKQNRIKYLPHALIIKDNNVGVIQASLLNSLINHQSVRYLFNNYFFIRKLIISEIKNREWLDTNIEQINNNIKYSYFMQYNEDKIIEKIINDILLYDYNKLICTQDGMYQHMIYNISHPPPPLFVSVDCSNRDELITKYIKAKNMKQIYTCTLTDTKYMNKCISFDKMYQYDYEWLLKEIMYNVLKSIDIVEKNMDNKYIVEKFIDALLEYKKNMPIFKQLETEIYYNNGKDNSIYDVIKCNEQIKKLSNGVEILKVITADPEAEADPEADKQQLLKLFFPPP
jgi:hypothetical protein